MRGEAFDNAGNQCHERMRLSPLHCERRREKCFGGIQLFVDLWCQETNSEPERNTGA